MLFIEQMINRLWYPQTAVEKLVSSCFQFLMAPWKMIYLGLQRRHRNQQLARQQPLQVPVIVIGNLSVGGTGKTPCVIALAKYLLTQELKVGVISRGYGGKSQHYPRQVSTEDSAAVVGDEPLLLAQQLPCPVIVDPQRYRAAVYLQQHYELDVIISDDGLQHYSLPRAYEILIIDQRRGLGNTQMLPAGPLREPLKRLQSVDQILVNGDGSTTFKGLERLPSSIPISSMQIVPLHFRHLADNSLRQPQQAFDSPVHALAGIGNPERFFTTLRELNIEIIPHPQRDHHRFSRPPQFKDKLPLIITTKDSVKYTLFNEPNVWVLDIEAELSDSLLRSIMETIEEK